MFPLNHTKDGQETIKTQQQKQEVSILSTQNEPQQQSLDMGKILPLLKLINGKKNISQNDMLQLVLPMLLGGNSVDFSKILDTLNTKQEQEIEEAEDISDNTVSISSYKKIE